MTAGREVPRRKAMAPVVIFGRARRSVSSVAAALLLAVAALPSPLWAADKKPEVRAGDVRISGPYVYHNLTVYLLHGPDAALKGKKILSLQQALEQKKVVVHETKNVNELTIENVSDDVEVFVQSGDIVKGGDQDRVFAC